MCRGHANTLPLRQLPHQRDYGLLALGREPAERPCRGLECIAAADGLSVRHVHLPRLLWRMAAGSYAGAGGGGDRYGAIRVGGASIGYPIALYPAVDNHSLKLVAGATFQRKTLLDFYELHLKCQVFSRQGVVSIYGYRSLRNISNDNYSRSSVRLLHL